VAGAARKIPSAVARAVVGTVEYVNYSGLKTETSCLENGEEY
jgi:hypothetical protein